MEARLAASMARLNQSIEQMRQIEERSKSTDATLARIARIQASWVPAEQVVQEGMERRRDSFSPQMGATAQALARISGVKAVTPTSSTVVHHDMKSETTTTMDDAHKVFDVWSTQKEVTMSNIIHVSVSHTIYPVTEVVLRQVFEMYGYSVTTMAVLQGRGWVEASVQLQSGHVMPYMAGTSTTGAATSPSSVCQRPTCQRHRRQPWCQMRYQQAPLE